MRCEYHQPGRADSTAIARNATAKISEILRPHEHGVRGIALNVTSISTRHCNPGVEAGERIDTTEKDWRLRMSKMCGDTARFYRIRAQRNRRRARVREMRADIEARKAASAHAAEKSKA